MSEWMRQPGGIERLERLISRHLDGEISAAEQAELDGVIAGDADARAIFEEYCELDARAGAVLRMDLVATAQPVARSRSPWWTTIFAAVTAAAAVVALSFVFESNKSIAPSRPFPVVEAGVNGRAPGAGIPPIDYRMIDYQPSQRVGDWRRDIIGIQGDNPNVILIIEQATQSSGRVPIYGDF